MGTLAEHLWNNHKTMPPMAFDQPANIVQSGSYSFNSSMHGNRSAFFAADGSPNYIESSEESLSRIETLKGKLDQKLGPEFISTRPGGGGTKLTYIEGWKLINIANEVFGFNGWSSQVVSTTVDFCDTSPDGRCTMSVTAIVRVTLRDGVYHEDLGCGCAENQPKKTAAFDKAKKEAITDALKRALRSFGNVMGNCLYDKNYCNEISKMKVQPIKLDPSTLHRRPEFDPANASRSSASSSRPPAPAQHPQAQPQPPRPTPTNNAPYASTSTSAYPSARATNVNQQPQAPPPAARPAPAQAPAPARASGSTLAPAARAPTTARVPAPAPVKKETAAATPLARQNDSCEFEFDELSTQELAMADMIDTGPPIHHEEDPLTANNTANTTASFEPVGHSTIRNSNPPSLGASDAANHRLPRSGPSHRSPEAQATRAALIAAAFEEDGASTTPPGPPPNSGHRTVGSGSSSASSSAARLAAIKAAMSEDEEAPPQQVRLSPAPAQSRSQTPNLGSFQLPPGRSLNNQNVSPFPGAAGPNKRTADGALKSSGDGRQPLAPMEVERDRDGWMKKVRRE